MSFSVVRNGINYVGNDIKCDSKTALNSSVSCLNDPSCLAYSEKNDVQCNKQGVESIENNDGMALFVKDTSSCIKKDSVKGEYVPAFCLSSSLPDDVERQNNLIYEMERTGPKVLVIGKAEDRVMFVQYINPSIKFDMAMFNKSEIPFINTDLGKKMTLFMYLIMTVKTTDQYRFEAMNNSGESDFFINGIPLRRIALTGTSFKGWCTPYMTLTAGDYFVCVSFDISKSTASQELFAPYVRKIGDSQTGTASAIHMYAEKPINFLSRLTRSKANADNSFCNESNYTTSEYCKNLIKSGVSLNSSIKDKCFTEGAYVGDEKCSSLINLSILKSPELNTELQDLINSEVTNWFKNKLSTLGTVNASELTKLNSLFANLYTLHGNFVNVFNEETQNAIISYCEPKVGDVPRYNSGDGICGKVYNMEDVPSYPAILKSVNKIHTDFCKRDDGTGRKRYETNTEWCTPMVKDSNHLNTEIISRCSPNGKWNIDDAYCNGLVDTLDKTGDVNSTLLTSLRNSKIAYSLGEIDNISSNPNLKSEKYITNQLYTHIKTSDPSLEEKVINDKFLDYCLTKDPYLTNSSCKGIYSKYNDNVNIIRSRASMRTKNCLSDDNLMTEMETKEAIEQNKNNCKSLVTGTDLQSVGTFGEKVSNYCSQGNNIISEDCKKYYNNIGNNLAVNIVKYKNSGMISSMTNKFKSLFSSKKESMEGDKEVDKPVEEETSIWFIILFIIVVCVLGGLAMYTVSKVGGGYLANGQKKQVFEDMYSSDYTS